MVKFLRILSIGILIFYITFMPQPANCSTNIVFRYDDFAPDKPGIRTINAQRMQIWKAEQKVDNLFAKFSMPYVIAIIPNPISGYGGTYTANEKVSFIEDWEKIQFVKNGIRKGRMEVALHGLSHINHAATNHRRGEFRERDYKSQLQDIVLGKKILCDSLNLPSIATFVPPAFGWDNNTAVALYNEGFSILAVDRYYYYASAAKLTVIPFTAQLWELESLISTGDIEDESIVVVLYHPPQIVKFDGLENRYFGIGRFEKLLEKTSRLPDVKVVTMQQLVQERDDLTDARYRAASSLWSLRSFWSRILPTGILPGQWNKTIYLSKEKYEFQVYIWQLISLASIITLTVIGWFIRRFIAKHFSIKALVWFDIAGICLFCLGIWALLKISFRGYHLTLIRFIPVSFWLASVLSIGKKCGLKIYRTISTIKLQSNKSDNAPVEPEA